MVCLWCGKKIGLMRGILDREFCSQVHRRLASKSPDRIAKEIDVTSEYDMTALWAVEKENKRAAKTGHNAVGVFAVLGIVLMAAIGLTSAGGTGGAGGKGKLPGPSLNPTAPTGWSNTISSLWRDHGRITLTHDFSQGIGDFVGARSGATRRDWSLEPSGLRPGRLRIWQKSTSLSDYDMEFMGQIEQKSMGWAFRAPDVHNYYASKLVLTNRSSLNGPNAGLQRFVVLDGKEHDRVNLPLPISLERGVPYQVHLSVMGSRFVTAVNGQVVSSWSDSRLSRGGVGFFSEDGEAASVKWVSVAERDSMLGRLLSHFSLFESPWPKLLYEGPVR